MAKSKRTDAPKLKQPEPVKHRPTKAEKEARASQVMTMLLGGARRIEVIEFARKTWGVARAQADNYIADATALIKAEANKTREELIVEHLGRMNQIYRSAHSAGDYHAAIKAQQDKAKLTGLYPDPKLRVESWQDEVVQLLKDGKVSVDDVRAEFDENEARRIIVAAGVQTNASRAAQGESGQVVNAPATGLDAPQPADASTGSPA